MPMTFKLLAAVLGGPAWRMFVLFSFVETHLHTIESMLSNFMPAPTRTSSNPFSACIPDTDTLSLAATNGA